MAEAHLAKLTEGQRQCLRLVLRHMSSKDIARQLDISPHTVDQRLKLAMKTLGAASRVEAARILAAAESGNGYQDLVHQRPDIAAETGPPSFGATAHEGQRTAGMTDPSTSADPLPPLLREAGHGDTLRRILWIAAIVAAVAVGFAAIFVGLNALSEFTR
jgi:DNA-binding CsgD family transcriptional regulator